MSLQERIGFASQVIKKRLAGQSQACPYCGTSDTVRLARKQLIVELRECPQCHLTFRYPKDDLADNFEYYQEKYQQGNVTDLPDEAEIPALKANNFANVGRNIATHLRLIRAATKGTRLLDYGASWGYCTWQFQQAGYEAVGFDISRPRAEYGHRMLGVPIVNDIGSLPDHSLDIVYTSHVLEHLPNPGEIIREFRRLLVKGGHLFIFVPNGAGEEARRLGVGWGPLINQRHVLALTPRFFDYCLSAEGFSAEFASNPYDDPPRPYDPANPYFDGEELLAVGTAL